MKSPLEQFDIINVKSLSTMLTDISLNNILIPFLFIIIITIYFFYLFNNRFVLISNYFQNIFENLYTIVIGIIKQQAHSYGLLWAPFIYTLFTFILFSNLLSLIPFGIALTSHLILIFLLSSTICVSYVLI